MDYLQRFINYAKIDTQADGNSNKTPSSEKQKNLGKLLVKELKELGLKDAFMDEYGIVYAHLEGEGDKIGFNAHIDTALEVTDTNVNPRIIKNYDGKDIKLNDSYILSEKEFPSLAKHHGKDLVVTDGNTLLGADDKAGIAIIMNALQYFKENPNVKHHNLSICFTVDEEIGEGPTHFSIKQMNADYAFTVDGGDIEKIAAENFNAKSFSMTIQGVAVHPGEGKNALLNAITIGEEFLHKLPKKSTPFYANENNGYWHINNFNGTSEKIELSMILREFDKNKLNKLINKIKKIINTLKNKYPKAKFNYSIEDEYENMKPYLDKNPKPINIAIKALKENGINPQMERIRGGTDGATFSKMGLPTPNLGTGSANHHGRFEYLVVQDFYKMIDVVISIMKI